MEFNLILLLNFLLTTKLHKMGLFAKDDLFCPKFRSIFNCSRADQRAHGRLSLWSFARLVEFYIGVFAKLKSQTVLVNDEQLTSSGFPVHFHAHQQRFKQTYCLSVTG